MTSPNGRPKQVNKIVPRGEIIAETVKDHALSDSELVGDGKALVFFDDPNRFKNGSPKVRNSSTNGPTLESVRKDGCDSTALLPYCLPAGYRKRCDRISLDGPAGYTFDVSVRLGVSEPLIFTLASGTESTFPVYDKLPRLVLGAGERIDVRGEIVLKKDQTPPDPSSKVRVSIIGDLLCPTA